MVHDMVISVSLVFNGTIFNACYMLKVTIHAVY